MNGPLKRTPLLALVGPTAAGKTALALKLAPLLNTEVICADSAQVYRRLDIGTAKPNPAERARVKHHLIDLVEPDCDFSVADYQGAAYRVIAGLEERGKLPFLVGGTGLYIKAVIDRYAFGEAGKDARLRGRLAAAAQQRGPEALHRRLSRLDPEAAARIHPRDERRIIRALEVYYREGRPISEQVAQTRRQKPAFNLLMFGLTAPRAALYRRIERRVDQMLAQGFLAEVRALLDAGFDPASPGLQILGYRQLVNHLRGETGLDEAVDEIKRQTRRLAKRQWTWFCRDRRVNWLEVTEDNNLDTLAEIICNQVKEKLPLRENNIP